jgi:hypothetical protein
MEWIWESQQLTPSSDSGDSDGGSENSIRFLKSLVASQSDDPDFLSIMEHTEELILGDSNEEDASGEEAPVEEDDDDEEEEDDDEAVVSVEEKEQMVPADDELVEEMESMLLVEPEVPT